MARILDNVVPWGRSLGEYAVMFDLSPADMKTKILDCGGGPASFTAEIHGRGGHAVACDPSYAFPAGDIRRRVGEVYETMVKSAELHRERFVWKEIESPEHLGRLRMDAMNRFLDDFPAGISEGRYRVAELPSLPFPDREFDLAVCSHFLFTYSDLFPLEFHVECVRELCRVAHEARIFPLLPNFGTEHSPHLSALTRLLAAEGYRCEVVRVPHEFQKGGNEMLRVAGPK
ncbi:MAG TPA: class I SAM-dependent methyltransferase [Candidatus Acidoferrales bacterium]|nr:class I SAM-dependent methyltransferase [Candidatus Acidoferrales bacterium]